MNTLKDIELNHIGGDEDNAQPPLLEKNFDLIKDVNVSLQIKLGETEMSVDKLFALQKGSVVALNETVEAPVEILLKGRVIACGKLSVIDENYAVTITHLYNNHE